MKWHYWVHKFSYQFCLAKGLSPLSLKAYYDVLMKFSEYMEKQKNLSTPEAVKVTDVLDYINYVRVERNNSHSSVNRNVMIIKKFYESLISYGHIDTNDNPLRDFVKLKGARQKFRDFLSMNELKRLLDSFSEDSIVELRDKSMIYLICCTGIRASECAGLRCKDIDMVGYKITVTGKGGDQRSIPINEKSKRLLSNYAKMRGSLGKEEFFFQTRFNAGVKRQGIYDRVKKYVRSAGITKKISPHNLRHTFAKHAIDSGMNIISLKDILGHRCITSTQRYIQMTLNDLRAAIDKHPARDILTSVADLLPDVRLPFHRGVLNSS